MLALICGVFRRFAGEVPKRPESFWQLPPKSVWNRTSLQSPAARFYRRFPLAAVESW
jgi:hypothetical protein